MPVPAISVYIDDHPPFTVQRSADSDLMARHSFDDDPLMPANQPSHPRFTLRSLLVAVSLLAVGLRVPGGAVLLGTIVSWIATGVVVLAALTLCQLPIYWLLRASHMARSSAALNAHRPQTP